MRDWGERRLGDLINVKHGYAFKGEYFGQDSVNPILVTPGNFAVGGGFKEGKARTYSGPMVEGFTLAAGDLIVSMTDLSKTGDTLGYPALVPAGKTYLHNQRIGLVEFHSRDVLPRFLYYVLMTKEYRQHILATATGSTVRHTSPGRIGNYKLRLPPLPVQHAIANQLGALDDKIAVNDRIAGSVDQYCAALYEDIVVRNSRGILQLREAAIVNAKSVKPTKGGSLRYIDIASVGNGTLAWPEYTSWDFAPSRARRGVTVGDTIWSTVRPNRRSHTLVLDDDPLLVASTGFAVITPRGVGPAFLYESARREEFVAYLESVAEGSAYPAVRAERFLAAPIPQIPDEHRTKFEALALQMRRRAHAAERENRVLVELRDALLPELMSGRLRVRDAENFVEEAV
jgi:type I restriction enzyme, S subunit